MVEGIVHDVLAPKNLIIPVISDPIVNQIGAPKGSIVLSGAKLYFHDGSAWVKITSA